MGVAVAPSGGTAVVGTAWSEFGCGRGGAALGVPGGCVAGRGAGVDVAGEPPLMLSFATKPPLYVVWAAPLVMGKFVPADPVT